MTNCIFRVQPPRPILGRRRRCGGASRRSRARCCRSDTRIRTRRLLPGARARRRVAEGVAGGGETHVSWVLQIHLLGLVEELLEVGDVRHGGRLGAGSRAAALGREKAANDRRGRGGRSTQQQGDDGIYHTYVGVMRRGCGINGFETNEEIVHATSASPPSALRWAISRPAPSAAKARATPCPMPRPAPVTIAVRPSSLLDTSGFSCRQGLAGPAVQFLIQKTTFKKIKEIKDLHRVTLLCISLLIHCLETVRAELKSFFLNQTQPERDLS